MQIKQLNFAAFGPFTDRELMFDQVQGGLHIVYGPNEAGKSSALRGLKALLYNIEVRTADNHLHANDKLRIEGCVRAASGDELHFVRRKGNKNTLLSIGGEALDDNALAPFLQGVTQELFAMLFGIDHRALLHGGQEILQQKGEVGQALFSASLGSHALRAVLSQLDEQANGLFRPQGSNPTINSALKNFSALKKQIRDRSLSSNEWDAQFRALAQTSNELDQIQIALNDNRMEINRLKRIQRALPRLAQRRALVQQIKDSGDVVLLADDFVERRQQFITKQQTAQAILRQAKTRLDSLHKQLDGFALRQEVLEQAENVEALHEQLGGFRKAMQDRPHLEAEYKLLCADAQSLLMDVRPDFALSNIEQLRPVFAKRQRITELGNQHPVLIAKGKQTQSELSETQTRLEETGKERQEIADIGAFDAFVEPLSWQESLVMWTVQFDPRVAS